ncbi:MAG: hypothetical protein NZ922_03710 [Candidatus Methanomethyliaceae archaeon]|nr:hypothetical protein [Candidatus Methanomethyliaceae archaeon]MCX8169995.1 hypothetical protein [Candidatus Methanomethyliaceae archaeon]MDW7970703.1 RNA-binding domain-containing protein [Nitrososphaerota archaeon]
MINSISISTIVHATEDFEKVKIAMLNLIPENLRALCEITKVSAKGHHGNPILLLSINFKTSELASEIFKYIINSLSKINISLIKNNPSLYSDENFIFLRLDKQAAYNGILRLSLSDDVIKVKISVSNPMEVLQKL